MVLRSLFEKPFSFSLIIHVSLVLLFIMWMQVFGIRQKADDWIVVNVDPIPKNRIVQTAPGQKVDQAVDDAYLGKQNQIVKKQTIAKHQKNALQQRRSAEKQRIQNLAKKGSLKRFGLPILNPKKNSLEAQKENAPRFVNLGSRPEDYIKGLKEGEKTALNTKEYVFFGYFERIRKRLELAWKPLLRRELIRFYRVGRRLASEKDHTTSLMVVLNRGGNIEKVLLMEESGAQVLDQAAVDAFNRAGPFPNPPSGIIDPDGKVKIRWDFVLRT